MAISASRKARRTSEDDWRKAENAAGKQGVVPITLLKIIEESGEETSPEKRDEEDSIVTKKETAEKFPSFQGKEESNATSRNNRGNYCVPVIQDGNTFGKTMCSPWRAGGATFLELMVRYRTIT